MNSRCQCNISRVGNWFVWVSTWAKVDFIDFVLNFFQTKSHQTSSPICTFQLKTNSSSSYGDKCKSKERTIKVSATYHRFIEKCASEDINDNDNKESLLWLLPRFLSHTSRVKGYFLSIGPQLDWNDSKFLWQWNGDGHIFPTMEWRWFLKISHNHHWWFLMGSTISNDGFSMFFNFGDQ